MAWALMASAAWANDLTLNWDPVPNVEGYKLHFGTEPGKYTSEQDVGKATTFKVTGLEPDKKYYFAVATYDANGRESELSKEVSYVPAEHPASK